MVISEIPLLKEAMKAKYYSKADIENSCFHYTNAKGLMGLLTSDTLWANKP